MSNSSTPPRKKCRPRFKGIESFLRRIAFNLGNTPSQTEVKIISCIPIDVTDLQRKILDLERQLEEKKEEPKESKDKKPQGKVVRHRSRSATRSPARGNKPRTGRSGATTVSTALVPRINLRSNISCSPCEETDRTSSSAHISCSHPKSSVCFSIPSRNFTPQTKKELKADDCFNCCQDPACCEHNNIGLVRKSNKPRNTDRTHMVYYTQTVGSPFTNYKPNVVPKKSPLKYEGLNRSYLTDVIRRQYKPDRVAADESLTSQFSNPVCRDTESPHCEPSRRDSDVCSCCRVQLHSVDHFPRVEERYLPTIAQNKYYDSTLYDVVPVRERPKVKDEDSPRKELQRKTCKSYSDKVRYKSRFQPYFINYNMPSTRPNNRLCHRRKLPVRPLNKKEIACQRKAKQQRINETPNYCSVDLGAIYSRPLNIKHRTPKTSEPPPPAPILQKNVECLTININSTECQTSSNKSVQLEPCPVEENKTEMTLNQIKSILQSVLTEVKTNSQNKNVSKDKPKTDAVEKNGPSQSNIMQTCSSLMNSYTYSPYKMNSYNTNPYVASCSRQLSPGEACCPRTGTTPYSKCLQNYPLFIHTTGRQCACCFNKIPNVPKPKHPAIAAATNTDSIQEHRTKETQKLIKEIYKSLAINVDLPQKDTSNSENDDLKSMPSSKKCHKTQPKGFKGKEDVATEVTNRWKEFGDTTAPFYTNTTVRSNIVSNSANMQTASKSTVCEQGVRARRLDGYQAERERPYVVELPNATTVSEETDSDEDTEEESDDTTTEVVEQPDEYINVKKKEKTGLFSKVVNLFKNKNKKEKRDKGAESEQSDSDDYQTIYSHRSERPAQKRRAATPRRRCPHSKVSYSRYVLQRSAERARRSPYLEQEYRRNWNEKLTFHEDLSTRYSSAQQMSESVQQQQQQREQESREAGLRRAARPPGGPGRGRSPAPPEVTKSKASKSSKGLAWLQKHKLGIACGEQWKKLFLEG